MSRELKGDFRKFMDKNYLGSWDVPDKGDLILTIDHAEQNDVKNERGSERKLTLHFIESGYKPMILNTTNAKAISKAYGSTKVEDWQGKKVAIFTTKVDAFGGTTDALRIRDYPPKTDELICEVCGEVVTDAEYDGKKYRAKAIANNALTKFNKIMCFDCYMLAKAEKEDSDGSTDE